MKHSLLLLFLLPCIAFGQLTDQRDGNTYKTVKIGNQVWMSQNLEYEPSSDFSWFISDDDKFSVAKYGYLYDWETACNVCLAGWHLPSDAEWTVLTDYLGGEDVAGTKMKSTSGWKDGGNGTNESGFNGLSGGSWQESFYEAVGWQGIWWSSTESSSGVYGYAWSRQMWYNDGNVDRMDDTKGLGLSVRCLKD